MPRGPICSRAGNSPAFSFFRPQPKQDSASTAVGRSRAWRDWIACQITSNPYNDSRAIALDSASFARGGLQRLSFVRPGKLFTANESLFESVPAAIDRPALERVRDAVIEMIRGG